MVQKWNLLNRYFAITCLISNVGGPRGRGCNGVRESGYSGAGMRFYSALSVIEKMGNGLGEIDVNHLL